MTASANMCQRDVQYVLRSSSRHVKSSRIIYIYIYVCVCIIEGSLDVKLPTIWTDEKQSREEAERRERLEERIVEEKE